MARLVVSDTTAIIHLARIGRLELLKKMYELIYIPHAVYNEIIRESHRPGASDVKNATWIKKVRVKNSNAVISMKRLPLDPGEAEAIVLAIELDACMLIIDEKKGRKAARTQSVPVKGLLGILLDAKTRGFIAKVGPIMDQLKKNQFKIDNVLYNNVLGKAGETDSESSSIA